MMQSKSKSIFKAGILMTCFVVGIAGGVIFANISSSVIKTPVYQKSWHLIPLFGEAVPAAGAGGILEVFFINW
jgi:F0F1-type ATP synthase membrane subunit c/vacuolar-type H+-ATPase subunit K